MESRFRQILQSVAELPDSFDILNTHELRSDLDIDSLRLIDVVLNVEQEFEVELGEEELAKVNTVGDLWQVVDGAANT